MSEDFDFDELLQEYGINDYEAGTFDDSGIGLSKQGDGYRQGSNRHMSDLPTQLDDGAPDMDDYSAVLSQDAFSDQLEDEIERIESSDPMGYNMSSPTPTQSRGFVSTSTLMPPRANNGDGVQQCRTAFTQPCVESTRNGFAYTQQGHGRMHAGGSSNASSIPRPSPHSAPRAKDSYPRNTHSLRLRPISDLPDIYRGIFKFPVFNAVQSTCYEKIMETKENMVVSAPTGGGKTVLFELGLIELLTTFGHQSSFKCVYVAPTKALCSERTRDWTTKFEPMGIKCCEMTGDTVQMGKSAWSDARNAKIIITTSEKWDSLTRAWHDHGDFLSEIKLFLVDEVHVLNEPRGSTLEVVISRMKTRAQNIRFILVSATVPNIRDIANWIGNPSISSDASATVYEFGEEYRPCKITRHIYGFHRKNQNDFQFARTLDYKLYSILQQHTYGKPILIFCSTRKGVLTAAEQLLKDYDEAVAKRETTPWKPSRYLDRTFHDKRLEKLSKAGLGVHHAGLSLDDRRAMEGLFLDGSLRVVCATSTLAVGVNLPAHTVIIKGVKLYVGNAWQEYSDLDVVQMIGRAGRPQFDKEGVAIILCEQELEHKYRNLAQGKTILESSLHENLLEHINSEIGIGAITDIDSAKGWLRNSFLRQRIQKNPAHYHIGKTEGQTWEEKMDDMVLQSVKTLEKNELVAMKGGGDEAELSVTAYGDVMSKYYIRQSTMGSILKLSERPSVREILEVISCAEELGDVRLRGGDKQVYNKMRNHQDIRYKMKKVEKASDKSFILIQAVLGGISLSAPEYKTSDSQPVLDALSVFRHTARIARVVVEVAIIKKNGAQLKHGLELVRSLTAKAWEDRPIVLKQIESIGEKSLKVLAEHGITSLQILRNQEPTRIELLLNRRPPYGHEVLQFVQSMPQYGLSITVPKNGIISYSGKKPVTIDLEIECYLLQALSGRKKIKQRSQFLGMTSILTTTSDLDLIDFRRISTKSLKDPRSFIITAELTKPSQSICVLISAENFAGLTVTQTYKPPVPAREYPTMDTQPKTANDLLLEECEQDPGFWDKLGSDDDVDDINSPKNSGQQQAVQHMPPLEAKMLPNGNYACNHLCKDKNACRHLCCREGTSKPPPGPRKENDEKKGPYSSQFSYDLALNTTGKAATKKRNEPTQPKKARKEDKRLEQLESLHKNTGTNKSLRLGEGQRLKLDNDVSKTKHKPIRNPQFDVQFAKLEDGTDEDKESTEEMPDTKELLASTQQKIKREDDSSDYNFSDSDLDAMLMKVDMPKASSKSPESLLTMGSGLGNERAVTNHTGTKRKLYETEISSTKPYTLTERTTKRTKQADRTTQSDDDPLFLHGSSSSSSHPTYPAPDIFDAETNDLYPEEDCFALDNSIFNIVPSSSKTLAQNADSSITTVQPVRFDKAVGKEEIINQEATADTAQSGAGNEHYDCGVDEWADMEDWIMNSGSVQIVD